MKKQPSASYVTKATASKSLKEQASPGGITKGDVANHGDFLRLESRSMAVTSNHKVGSITPNRLLHHLSGKGMESIPGVITNPYAHGPREAQPA
jgi:hypothetical protein